MAKLFTGLVKDAQGVIHKFEIWCESKEHLLAHLAKELGHAMHMLHILESYIHHEDGTKQKVHKRRRFILF